MNSSIVSRSVPSRSLCRTLTVLWAIALLFILVACKSHDGPEANTDSVDLLLPIPEFITRVVDPQQVGVDVLVDGNLLAVSRVDGNFSSSVVLAESSTPLIQILLFENFNGRRLPLATFEQTLPAITSNVTLNIGDGQYQDAGLDEDDDGLSNLSERQANTDPYNINDPGGRIHLRVPLIAASDAPVIDGLYDRIWDMSRFVSTTGAGLGINHLMIDRGPLTRRDGEAEFRFSIMHDNEHLYFFVLGENVEGARLFADSDNAFDDDNLNIFIDGDNSKLAQYDGVNDFHILIPLLKRDGTGNRGGDADSRLGAGPSSSSLPADVVFTNCRCEFGQHVWEVRLRLSDMGIVVQQEFGLDLQLDDDNDGDIRDARWGWAHPSRSVADIDFTVTDPSFMGTAILE